MNCRRAFLSVAVVLGCAGQAAAAVWYYDTSADPGLGGSPAPGNWASGAGGAMWSTDPTGSTAPVVTAWNLAADNDAIFDGTPATVNISSGGVTVGGIDFRATGYTLGVAAAPAAITFVSSTRNAINVVSGTATVNNPFVGSTGYQKTGAGTLILTATTGHTITGPVSITGGTLQLAGSGSIGGTGVGSGDVTIDGGTFRNNVSSGVPTFLTGNRGIVIGSNGGTIDVPGTAIQIYTSGSITGPGNTLTKSGTGTLRVSTPTSITFSKLVVTGGLYQAGADTIFGAVPGAATADAITLNGGGISSNGGFSFHANRGITLGAAGGTINTSSSSTVLGKITGVGSLTKTGSNILTLSGDNDYSGDTHLNVGRINFNHNNAAGTGTINVANAAGIEFTSTAAGVSLGNEISLAGGANTAKFYATSGNSLTLTGKITGAGGILRDDNGAGTLTLAGDSDFTGGVKVVSRGIVVGHKNGLGAGVLALGDATTAPANPIAISASTPLTGASAVANSVSVARDFTVAGSNGIEFSGPVDLGSATRIVTVSNTAATIVSGVVSGGVGAGLTKSGAGDLTLTGANDYSGPTVITSGTLYANNSTGSATGDGSVTINPAGTLAGSGAVSGTVLVNGTLSPGNSIESLSVGALTLAGTSNSILELDSSGVPLAAAADLMNVSGWLTIDAGAKLTLLDVALVSAPFAPGTKFTLFRYDANGWNGETFDGLPDDSVVTVGATMFTLNYNDLAAGVNFGGGAGGGHYVTLTAVPEASAILFGSAVALIGGTTMLVRRRRPRAG
ncbi:MAG: autotransporter-associated beta strand repeat-containing protein [Pirellulales bacterium]|nr:autotransporter-associated beta strand repeat-containing protein [Pirellulales bacterium]